MAYKRATLKEVAHEAGVSVDTVSRVLNGRNKELWPSIAARATEIRAIAERLDYRPNILARSTRTGRFGNVALLQSTVFSRSILAPPLLDGIQESLSRQNMPLMVMKVPDEVLTPAGIPKVLRQSMTDGLLINYQAEIPPQIVAALAQAGVPVVWINSKQPVNSVYPQDFAGSRSATEYLVNLGHRRIGFVENCYDHSPPGWPAHYSGEERYEGYAEAMRRAGLPPRLISRLRPLTAAEILDFSREWLAADDRPTAALIYCAYELYPVLYAAALLGLKVPRDLSVLAFSSDEIELAGSPMTRMSIPWRLVGSTAVDMLLEMINSGRPELPSRPLPLQLEVGASCAPPLE